MPRKQLPKLTESELKAVQNYAKRYKDKKAALQVSTWIHPESNQRICKTSAPLQQVFDLSQTGAQFMRTENYDGTMMCVKTNTKLFNTAKGRILTHAELCSVMALPATDRFEPCLTYLQQY